MRIIQITDLHINSPNEDTRGVDVRGNFLNVIEALKLLEYDHLVVSGDLCLSKGDISVYKWIKGHLNSLNKPYHIMSGNHDDNDMISKVYGYKIQDHSIYYKKKIGENPIYFCDTSTYVWPESQMQWLKTELLSDSNKNLVIFIHHPPVKSGAKFMDSKHPLENINEAKEFFRQFTDKEFYIFCGHCHIENYIKEDNMNVFVTPSSYFQMQLDTEDFTLHNNIPAYRIINIDKFRISTNVIYLN